MRWLAVGICLLAVGVCSADDTPPALSAATAPATTPASVTAPAAASPATTTPVTTAPVATAPLDFTPFCSNSHGAPVCPGSRKDLKAARKAFERGLNLEKSQNLDQAFEEFQEAARLVPQNIDYVTARETTRQHLAGAYLEHGNNDLLGGRQVEAMAEFSTALNLDPQNEFAQQRIRDAMGPVSAHSAVKPFLVASADAITAKPADSPHDFHYRGDSRGLLTAVAASYGLTVTFDDSFTTRHVQFDLEGANFATALAAASAITKSFSVPLEDTVLYAAADTADNHRLYDRMGLRVFYMAESNSPSNLNEFMNAMRTVFEIKFASLNSASNTITLRAPVATLEAMGQFFEQVNTPRPEVMFDIKVFEVSDAYTRQIGLHVPDNFNLFSLASIVDQLNAANSTSIAALVEQLESQQNSILSQPVATFGGGLSLAGLTFDQLSAVLSLNESSVQQLEHVQLRASQQQDANFKLGERYPILNSSYSAGLSSSVLALLGSAGAQAQASLPIPSISYEDLGLTLKAKPTIHTNSDVSVELEIAIRSLGTTVTNGIPDILNREYKGGIIVKEGEPAVVAGMVTHSEENALAGLPLVSAIPAVGLLTSQKTKQIDNDELLILITPFVIRSPERAETTDIWLPATPTK
jgi:general secretion pathway protein D